MRRLRRHVTYANIVSTLALVLALSGGAVYAAGKIGGKQIRKGAIHSFQIKNRQVRRQDIAGGSINSRKVSNASLTGKDIKDDSLSGHDIDEGSLGLVPLAQDTRTVNGITERVIHASQADPSGANQVIAQGGLAVLLSCTGGIATMQVHGSAPGDQGTVFDPLSGIQQFDSGTTQLVNTGAAVPGFVTVRRLDGIITRFEFELDRVDNGFGSADDCFLHGFLFSGR